MPIGFGLGSSHASFVTMKKAEEWIEYYRFLIRDVPQPPEAALESTEIIQSHIDRVHRAFQILAAKLAEYRPDLLIIIGGDQSEMFDDSNVPNIMIYAGEEARGYTTHRRYQPGEEDIVRLKVDVDTSKRLLNQLVRKEGFDVAFSGELSPLGRSSQRRKTGVSHAFMRPAPFIIPRPDLPTVLIWENTYDPPSLPAKRCYELGHALARFFKNDPRRIAILGSGGLSHDPGGPRSGWIDEVLDRWFLDQMTSGNGQATTAMYQFDSMTMRGGTGEMRAWITAAGAMEVMGSRAVVVDYIAAHHAVTGLGFAYWSTPVNA